MPTDEEVKAEGEKIKTRLAAGEDFDKLQKEIYTTRGYQAPPPRRSCQTGAAMWCLQANSACSTSRRANPKFFVDTPGASVYRLRGKRKSLRWKR